MRILHLLSQTELTGAEVYAQNLIRAQLGDGHEVHVISDHMHVPLPIDWTSLPLSTSHGWQRWQNIFQLRKFLIEKKIEVIHCHSRGAVRHADRARLFLPVAVVTSLHGRQHFSWSKKIFDLYGEIRLAVCENVKKAMIQDFKMPGSSIWISRNPVEASRSTLQPASISSPLRIALLGRSSGPKGKRFEKIIEQLAESWLTMSPQLQFVIVAPRPERFASSTLLKIEDLNRRLNNRIEVQGHLPDLREHLKNFSLTICSGRIAIESLLEGVPCLALGEHSSPGLVVEQNFQQCLESNFGDMGSEEVEIPLDLPQLDKSVQDFLRGQRPSLSELQNLQIKAQLEFDPDQIHLQVLEAYRAAIFKRHVPQWMPVLMYHKIPVEELQSRHRIFVTRENFRKHLAFFQRQGFSTVTFSDLREYWLGLKDYREFPTKPLMLTFDDGYIDNLTEAEPLLREFGFRAVIFLLGNHQILENTWDADTGEKPQALMSFEEKKKLDSNIWEIGSHGFDHLHLPQVSEEQAFQEMQNSKLQLEKDFNRPILAFAYPFGSTNGKVASLCQKAGYSFAVNTDQGGLHLADQPHSIFRVNIFPEDGPTQLWKKTSSWYRKYFYRKRQR